VKTIRANGAAFAEKVAALVVFGSGLRACAVALITVHTDEARVTGWQKRRSFLTTCHDPSSGLHDEKHQDLLYATLTSVSGIKSAIAQDR